MGLPDEGQYREDKQEGESDFQHSLSKVTNGYVLYRHRHVQSGSNHRTLPTINRS